MNQAFTQNLMRPNLPLRRPATGPSPLAPRGPASMIQERPQENPQGAELLDASVGPKGDAVRKNNEIPVNVGNFVPPPQTAVPMVKLCNYCSLQGNFRCNRCKKTCYCSVACQTQDWKAHRHVCKPSIPEAPSEKTKDLTAIPCGNGLGGLQAKEMCVDVEPKRMYRCDLRKHNVSKGAQIQGTVIEMRNPGMFFIHVQSMELMESLENIIRELQKANSTSFVPEYKPEIGEICAVKFSIDKSWYRAEVQSVDVARKTASVFYIDFGNEENVTLDKIRPLSDNIDTAPPFALQCCIAGVKPLTGSWTGECTIAFKQLVTGKSLTFSVLDILNDGALLALDFSVNTFGKHMSTFLIDQSYAIKEVPLAKQQMEHDINSLLTASFENFMRLSEGKNENSEARPPDPLSQGVGDTFTAVVTHLQSPSEILCQKIENASVIQQLQVKLRDHCSNTPASENFRPAPGTICCSLFSEDNQWYRAKVLAYSSEDYVCVGYIDFGNSEEVKLNRLRPISIELLALPTQAIPCSLAGIKSLAGTWSEEAILMLKHLVCNHFIRVEILGKKDGRALVSMINETSDPQTNIAEMLVNMDCAAIESVETEKKETAPASFPEMPSLAEKLKWTCAELPFDGQKVELVISSLKSLDEFYCYNYSKADSRILTELSCELMKHCESDRSPFTPTVEKPCCALFTGDAQWYRAMVLEVCRDGKARVCFVDYGNVCEVEAAHMKAITPSLLELPFQAMRCQLAGVEPVDGQWSKEALHRFQTLTVSKPLSGKVLSVSKNGYSLELECDGKSIADVLISEHLARPYGQLKQPPLQPAKPTNQIEELPNLKPIDHNPPAEEPLKVNNKEALSVPEDSSGSFPLNWKTLELTCTDTFQPRVAAVISPSLFYIMNPGQVNVDGLKAVMNDIAKYCSRQSVPNQCHPLPGAACCAQFSGDKNWYRAVVLEVTSKHAHVIYADYGNMETVPVSSVLPITKELLKHPFQIVRCALAGKERFPTVWPTEVLELFGVQLSGGVLASLQGFDGTFNLLTLTQQSGQTNRDINSITLGAVLTQGPSKANTIQPNAAVEEKDAVDQTQSVSANKAADQTQSGGDEKTDLKDQAPAITSSNRLQEPENGSNMMVAVECTAPQDVLSATGGSAPQMCCCLELKQKIDHIEKLVLLLVKQVGGSKE